MIKGDMVTFDIQVTPTNLEVKFVFVLPSLRGIQSIIKGKEFRKTRTYHGDL